MYIQAASGSPLLLLREEVSLVLPGDRFSDSVWLKMSLFCLHFWRVFFKYRILFWHFPCFQHFEDIILFSSGFHYLFKASYILLLLLEVIFFNLFWLLFRSVAAVSVSFFSVHSSTFPLYFDLPKCGFLCICYAWEFRSWIWLDVIVQFSFVLLSFKLSGP